MNRIANNPDYDRLGFGRSPNEAAGAYSRQFLDRARAAVFHKAYGDEALTAMSAESADPEIKNILNALSLAAPNFVGMGPGPLDIRPFLAQAIHQIRDARARGLNKDRFLAQMDMFGREPLVDRFIDLLWTNIRSFRKLGESLREMADFVQVEQSRASTADMFGGPKATIEDVIARGENLLRNRYGGESTQEGLFGVERPEGGGHVAEGRAGGGQSVAERRTTSDDGQVQEPASGSESESDRVEESSGTQDLFNQGFELEPGVSHAAGRSERARARGVLPESGSGAVRLPSLRSRAAAILVEPEGSAFAVRVEAKKILNLRVQDGALTSAADVASAMASIRKQPQENLLVLLTDESDKPLNILRHSIGKKDETIVDPSIVIGHAARVPKARNMWLVHNHPSGLSTLSGADVNMSKTMARLLDGSGIRYQGLMAVGRDRFSHVDARGHIVQERVRPVLRSRQIPVVERAFVRRGTLGAVITPQNVVDIAAKVSGGKDGVMLLDTQLQPTAFLPMTANEMGKLRGTGGLEKLLSGVEKSNASMAITVVHETESAAQARNLNSALEASGIRVLDIVASGKPLTQVGQALRRTGNTPFESRQPRPSAGVSASAAGKAAAQFMSKLPGAARLKVIVVRSLKDIPEESKPSDMAEGVYYPAGDEGRIYLVADNLTTMLRLRQVLAHEVVGHFGVEALLGHQFDGVLADVRRLARVPRGQHATGDEELGDANYATMEAVGMRYSDYDAKARAREVLARMAEEGRFRTFLATVYAKIRKALRALGFDLKLTTADLRQMVIDAGKFLRTAPAGQAFARTRAAAASMAASEGGTEPRTVTQQAQREERQTERAYGGRPTYDRARAAGRTKLNYQQWVQVRTPAFKQWFGDWEAVRAQQRLDAMKPVTVRVPDEWRGLSHSELRQRMAESLDRMVRDRTEIEHPEIGLIRVGRAGAKKSTGSARDPAKSLVVADIGALIPKTIYARSEHSSGGDGPDIAGYSTLLARVSVDEVPMVAAFTVRHQSDGKWYYNAATLHDADKKARDSYGRPDHRSGSSFAPISGLEDFIRRPLVRVNPTDVSEAVDPGTGEPLVVYHGTYEDFTTFETGHPGSVGDSPSNAFYFTPDPTVAKMYVPGGDVMQVYLSAENPLDLRTPEGLAALNSAIEDGEVSGPLYGLKPSKGFKKGNLWDQIMEMEPKEPNDLLNGIADWARDNGYGGLVFRDVIEGNEADSYAVFSPEQIKSATGNRGTFSSDSANITESRRDDAPVDLPDAIVGRALGDASKHPDYAAAKAGDTEAAARLVNDLVTPEMITKVRDALGDKKPIVVPVLAIESTGQNKIPLAVAHRVAAAFGLDVDYGIFQSVKAGRTSLTGLDRIFQQPEFDGTVRAGQQYLLVDDTLTQGGTMAALASHIRQHGGDVAGVFALTGKQYSATLRLSHDTLKTLRERYGDIENEFRAATGRGFDSLTESEGRYLATHGAPDVIRARILAEGHARSGGVLQKTLGPEDDRLIAQQSDTKAPPSAGLSSDGPRESRARGNSTARTQKMMRDRALHESGIFAEKETIKARFNRLTENARAKAIQGLFDHFYSLKSLDETAYMQARLSRGHEGAAEYLVRFGPVILRQGAIDGVRGKGLAEILADLDGEHDHFMAWIAGNRAERLMSEGRENLFDVETIARFKTFNTGKMSDGRDRGPVYAQALKELNVLQKSVLDVAEKAGLINRESRMLWEHEFYVPFYRAMESDSTGMMGPGQIGGLVGQYAFKRLKGGKEKLNDLVGNTIANWSHLISASMKNLAAQKAIEAARSMGIATHVNHPTKNGVRIMFDGLDRYFVVDDPMVLESLTALHWNGFGGPAWEAMKKARHALTMGVTLSPTFRIRNLLRDTLQALAIESNISVNPVMNLAVGWEATKSGSDTMQRLLAGGGAIRFGSFNDGNARNVKRLVDELQIDRNQVVTSPRQLIRLLKASFDWYQELGDRGETVNRAAIYEAARKNGKSHLEASYLARDLMDFSSVGSWASIRMLAQTVSFMNARMQGMYRLGRSAHENFPRFAAVTGVMALATIGLYLVMRDDKDYKELPDWARNTYWAFKIPGIDRMFFIPKPFEVGALATVLERGAELAFSGEDYRLGDFAQSTRGVIEDQLSMNPIPQLFKPTLEASFNYDLFRERDIDSPAQQQLPAGERHTASTSAGAIALGRAIDISPQRIEFLMSGYFGWVGIQALNVADYLARPMLDLPQNPRKDLGRIDNWFIMGDFVKDPNARTSKYIQRYFQRYYDMQREINEVYAAYNNARKMGDYDRAREFASSDLAKYHGMAKDANRTMAKITAEIRRLENDRELSMDEKRARLDQLYLDRNRLAATFDARVRERQ